MNNGKDAGGALLVKAGDRPRFVEIDLVNPRTVTIEADSDAPQVKILLIDPVAIQKNATL